MTIAVDWDVKKQTKQTKLTKLMLQIYQKPDDIDLHHFQKSLNFETVMCRLNMVLQKRLIAYIFKNLAFVINRILQWTGYYQSIQMWV